MVDEATLPPPRIARLVLVTPDGAVVGSLPPFPVELPWWQVAESVVQAARQHHGIDVTILRLLEAERDRPHGGEVTYLAEIAQPIPAEPWNGRLDPHPLRLSYAEPGGPAADLAWAESVLDEHGMTARGKPVQVRSWNLSSVWRIPIVGQTAWLKVVPPFFAHEAEVIAAMAGGPVPELLGRDGGRMLLAEIPGEDLYDATLSRLLDMVSLLVRLQASWVGRVEAFLPTGLPDWRAPGLTVAIANAVERTGPALPSEDAALLDRFVGELPSRFAGIASCGLPETLVHGDFHPGNLRGTADSLTLLDWGDSCVGHPLLDQSAFLDRITVKHRPAVARHWSREWLAALPASDPDRAAKLLAPVAAARQAVIYQRFLDNIEPSEQIYHRFDPADWLRRTAGLLQQEAD